MQDIHLNFARKKIHFSAKLQVEEVEEYL